MTETEILTMLAPLLILQIALTIAALIHIFSHDKYKVGNRVLWVLVVLLINTIGPILYFALGRGE
ncbi:PLDc N-terminal domain-containing protein [Mollicutes bacterium LVI A0039]|nr:PLDc N-terminal domain-containing protein [Mollicutes bacterium LVI A0039]